MTEKVNINIILNLIFYLYLFFFLLYKIKVWHTLAYMPFVEYKNYFIYLLDKICFKYMPSCDVNFESNMIFEEKDIVLLKKSIKHSYCFIDFWLVFKTSFDNLLILYYRAFTLKDTEEEDRPYIFKICWFFIIVSLYFIILIVEFRLYIIEFIIFLKDLILNFYEMFLLEIKIYLHNNRLVISNIYIPLPRGTWLLEYIDSITLFKNEKTPHMFLNQELWESWNTMERLDYLRKEKRKNIGFIGVEIENQFKENPKFKKKVLRLYKEIDAKIVEQHKFLRKEKEWQRWVAHERFLDRFRPEYLNEQDWEFKKLFESEKRRRANIRYEEIFQKEQKAKLELAAKLKKKEDEEREIREAWETIYKDVEVV